ncbi:MAG: phosphatase PAP2 family protein [Micavibrio sp.]|nr:phosphatase PAP2 family protein [Micavibrio sp.]
MTPAWRQALLSHRALLVLAVIYSVAVLAEAMYCGVPAHEVFHALRYAGIFLLTISIFAAGIYAGTYFGIMLVERRNAWTAVPILEERAGRYFSSADFTYACMGALVLLGNSFFLISKSLINVINPLHRLKWDFYFSAWDKFLHAGHYPHDLLLPAINAISAGRVLDFLYFFWLNAIFLLTLYNLFGDKMPHRRLRFLWVYFLSWVLLGSLAATVFNSVGPLFYHSFYPETPDVYAAVGQNIDTLQKQAFTFAGMTRVLLLRWQGNDAMIDANAISAMPSMHVAIAWLAVLYAREINRCFFYLVLLFFVCILIGSVYLGFHYAIDGYVSVIAVSMIWWIMGKVIDRHFTRVEKLGDA